MTKLDPLFSIIALFVLAGCSKCSEKKGDYQNGYTHGKIASYGNGMSCASYVHAMGWNEGNATTCFCEGFSDGQYGRTNEYPESETEDRSDLNIEAVSLIATDQSDRQLISDPDNEVKIEGEYIGADFNELTIQCMPTFRIAIDGQNRDVTFNSIAYGHDLFIQKSDMPFPTEANPQRIGHRFLLTVVRGIEYPEYTEETVDDEGFPVDEISAIELLY